MSNPSPDQRKGTSPTCGSTAAVAFEDSSGFLFDTKTLFEQWMTLTGRPDWQDKSRASDVTFEGVLNVDGFWSNNIRSVYGTLVMTQHGRVEGNIEVRVALIDGYFDGTLRASEQVVLERNARVFGSIHTPSLIIRDGALFEGISFLVERNSEKSLTEVPEFHRDLDLLNSATAGA